MSVEFSKLRHRILLQKPLLSDDGGGGASVQWLDIAEVWAEVTPIASRQIRHAQANTNPVRQRVRLRWRADVRENWRLVFQGRLFAIQSLINPHEAGELLVLECEEKRPT
jgi:SPP1 family predicted phage head-tail adaptor